MWYKTYWLHQNRFLLSFRPSNTPNPTKPSSTLFYHESTIKHYVPNIAIMYILLVSPSFSGFYKIQKKKSRQNTTNRAGRAQLFGPKYVFFLRSFFLRPNVFICSVPWCIFMDNSWENREIYLCICLRNTMYLGETQVYVLMKY